MSEALDVQPGETILVNGAGGVTGGMIVELAANRSSRVIATASESSAARVLALGADVVVDYHDPEWTSLAREAAGSSGIRAAANAAGGGEADALSTLVDGGRLATITGAPPPEERGISITNVIVRPDGDQLRLLAASLAEGKLRIDIRATYPLTRRKSRRSNGAPRIASNSPFRVALDGPDPVTADRAGRLHGVRDAVTHCSAPRATARIPG